MKDAGFDASMLGSSATAAQDPAKQEEPSTSGRYAEQPRPECALPMHLPPFSSGSTASMAVDMEAPSALGGDTMRALAFASMHAALGLPASARPQSSHPYMKHHCVSKPQA